MLNSRTLNSPGGHGQHMHYQSLPSGTVLPHLLWSMVVELNNDGSFTVGYADNLAILINGKFPSFASEQKSKNCARMIFYLPVKINYCSLY
jgi:hypothetical protein